MNPFTRRNIRATNLPFALWWGVNSGKPISVAAAPYQLLAYFIQTDSRYAASQAHAFSMQFKDKEGDVRFRQHISLD